ncbi:HERV-H LTR-associating protein 2 [Nannospalax galili]|uniref:HERV-H LTR-associating protein 2 n=1 Tax=Nannospalax galili TaxID=1026970 RepID=UPI000819E653|nr:HERV-H LTR-associating protein 2 [Nannospalax galili]
MRAQAVLSFFFIIIPFTYGFQDMVYSFLTSPNNNTNEKLAIGRYDEDVILPCSFKSGPDVVIHWKNQDNFVHSYYEDRDHLERQYPRYVHRTSLFHSEIHNGNASLSVKRLNLLDEGIYVCYVGTNSGYITNKVVLKVGAFQIPTMKYENRGTESFLVCSISSVYPRPRITWKMENASVASVSESNSKETGIWGLFCINSILNITESNSSYECAIENSLLHQTWRGRWVLAGSHWKSRHEAILLSCPVISSFLLPNQGLHVTWTKVENGSSSILASHLSSSQDTTINDPRFSWNKELIDQSDFSMVLTDLNPSDSGEYLCNISSREYTLLTVHRLHVALSQRRDSWKIRTCIFLVALLEIAFMGAYMCCFRMSRAKRNRDSADGDPGCEDPPNSNL